jgi:hypothetical protein
MFHKLTIFLGAFFLLGLNGALYPLWAQSMNPSDTTFEKPYLAEEKVYGYDPEGIVYHANRWEDFQIFLISSAPFTGVVSLGIVSLTSYLATGKAQISGPYLIALIAGTLIGSTAIAVISISGKTYGPNSPVALNFPAATTAPELAFALPIVQVIF